MGYPDYPNNRLIVGGVDLSERFKMVLLDGYTLTPPSPKTYIVDIPGGNGKLDLTESLFGDVTYDNRSMEFTFAIIGTENFEAVKTEITNFLHGRVFDFQMTMDPNYIYRGRFTVSSYAHSAFAQGIVGQIKVSIDAEPFKHKQPIVRYMSAIGGNKYYFVSGRERVCPTIETDGWLRVIHDGKQVDLQQGTWTINDLLFKEGVNELYVNSYSIHNLTWGELLSDEATTWKEFGEKPLYEWYKTNGDGTTIVSNWNSLSNTSWKTLEDEQKKWSDLTFNTHTDADVKDIYLKYEWGDL